MMKRMIIASAIALTGLSAHAQITATASNIFNDNYPAQKAVDGNKGSRWATKAGVSYPVTLDMTFENERTVSKIWMDEWFDKNGERIQKFEFAYKKGNEWVKFAEGTTVGKDFTLQLSKPIKAKEIRLSILESLKEPTINEIVFE